MISASKPACAGKAFFTRFVSHFFRESRFPIAFLALSLASACGGGGGAGGSSGTDANALTPASASAAVVLQVPQQLSQPPFDAPKSLNVPPGFGIRVLARISGARFMALAPDGGVLVSKPGEGKIFLLREQSDGSWQQSDFAAGLRLPHDMIFHQINGVTYLYVAESNRVTRSVYASGQDRIATQEVVVDGLPDSSTPELQGTYAHELKNIALSPDNKLYVSIASSCNACAADTISDPARGAIYQYNADGSGGRLFAKGIRNAEGLDFIPGSSELWAAINSRDEVPYPFDNDIDGDGAGDLGKLITAYTDRNPADLFTRVRDGGNYGWPFCNPVPNAQMRNPDLAPDYDWNRGGTQADCAAADRATIALPAHSAPLGMSMLQASHAPLPFRGGAVIALHGCWNCSTLDAGYKVVFIPFDGAGSPGGTLDLVSGFVTDAAARSVWGRPVDVIADAKGGILISDDLAGAIYRLYRL